MDLSHPASLPADVEAYLARYPQLPPDRPDATLNREFFSNLQVCRPDGLLIDTFLSRCRGDYERLEEGHGFIQWLFPIHERGVNSLAQPLQRHEAEFLRNDTEAQQRLVACYELMLDFYGMRLVSHESGTVVRSHHFAERYANLINNPHNNLRVCRILKCLGEMGLEHLQLGLCLHLCAELRNPSSPLATRRIAHSATHYWFPTLRSSEAIATLDHARGLV